jgi:hypothetical protein
LEQQISLLLLRSRRSLVKIDNILSNLPHVCFKFRRRVTTAAFYADFFAQSFAIGV